ncbi:MAG TPA: Rho termination factor N-terminal domain-containing protein [Acidimicrobiales bacterium]|nr:Rho termination factor N-terminal domain-containing protein [Acidimicrobiales bacterium]
MTAYRDRREAGQYAYKGTIQRADAPAPAEAAVDDLDAMTKDQLIEKAQSLGISPAHQGMSKADLIAAIRAHEG